jgi:hypothetical protein
MRMHIDFFVAQGMECNFESVVERAKLSCFNNGNRIEDHFVDVTEMITLGSGAKRPGEEMPVPPVPYLRRLVGSTTSYEICDRDFVRRYFFKETIARNYSQPSAANYKYL